jgi:hypothetical protein
MPRSTRVTGKPEAWQVGNFFPPVFCMKMWLRGYANDSGRRFAQLNGK